MLFQVIFKIATWGRTRGRRWTPFTCAPPSPATLTPSMITVTTCSRRQSPSSSRARWRGAAAPAAATTPSVRPAPSMNSSVIASAVTSTRPPPCRCLQTMSHSKHPNRENVLKMIQIAELFTENCNLAQNIEGGSDGDTWFGKHWSITFASQTRTSTLSRTSQILQT